LWSRFEKKQFGSILFLILLLSIPASINAQTATEKGLVVTTDKTSYSASDYITVKANYDRLLKGTLELYVIGSDGNIYLKISSATNDEGYTELKFSHGSFIPGKYTLKANIKDHSALSSKSVFTIEQEKLPTARCYVPLENLTMPFALETRSGVSLESSDAVVEHLAVHGVNSTSQILEKSHSASDLSLLAQEVELLDESMLFVAQRVELYCALLPLKVQSASSGHALPVDLLIELLDTGGYRSVYQLNKVDPTKPIQLESLIRYLEKTALLSGSKYVLLVPPPLPPVSPPPVLDKTHRGSGDFQFIHREVDPYFNATITAAVQAAQNISPLFKFGDEENITFDDGSKDEFAEDANIPYERDHRVCEEVDLKLLQKGFPIAIDKEAVLRLDIKLRFSDPALITQIKANSFASGESPAFNLKRNLVLTEEDVTMPLRPGSPIQTKATYYSTSMYVWIKEAGEYFYNFPNVSDLAGHYPDALPVGKVCPTISQFKSPSGQMGGLVIANDTAYYPFTYRVSSGPSFFVLESQSNKNFSFNFSQVERASDYIVIAPHDLPPFPGSNNGTLSGEGVEFNYSDYVNSSNQLMRQWKIFLGDFTNVCMDCGDTVSFFGDPQSYLALHVNWKVYEDKPQRFYVNTLKKIVFSNDADPGKGEMNVQATDELTGTDDTSSTTEKKMVIDYPFSRWREVNDNGKSSNYPLYYPDVPVLGIRTDELNEYEQYNISIGAYEQDNAQWAGFLAFFLLNVKIFSFASSLVACVGGAYFACPACACNLLSFVDQWDKASDLEGTENMGLSSTPITAESNFAINATSGTGHIISHGYQEADETVYDKIGIPEGACELIGTVTGIANFANDPEYWKKAFDAIGTLYNGGSLTGFLNPDYDKRWHYDEFDIKNVLSVPTISELKIVFDNYHVHNDRDGGRKGSGDTYTHNFVATIGDKGIPSTEDSSPLADLVLQNTTFTDGSFLYYPSSGNFHVNSGETQAANQVLFHRTYDPEAYVAGVYVEISIYESDTGDDDEIGVASKFYDFQDLSSFMNKCADQIPGYLLEDGWCKVSQMYHAEPGLFIQDNGEGQGEGAEMSSVDGGHINYEIWIKPRI
jgi:hypothetical protein